LGRASRPGLSPVGVAQSVEDADPISRRKSGSSYTAMAGDTTSSPGMPISEGENLEVDPPRRLVQSFRAL
jgi:hypothetical protein